MSQLHMMEMDGTIVSTEAEINSLRATIERGFEVAITNSSTTPKRKQTSTPQQTPEAKTVKRTVIDSKITFVNYKSTNSLISVTMEEETEPESEQEDEETHDFTLTMKNEFTYPVVPDPTTSQPTSTSRSTSKDIMSSIILNPTTLWAIQEHESMGFNSTVGAINYFAHDNAKIAEENRKRMRQLLQLFEKQATEDSQQALSTIIQGLKLCQQLCWQGWREQHKEMQNELTDGLTLNRIKSNNNHLIKLRFKPALKALEEHLKTATNSTPIFSYIKPLKALWTAYHIEMTFPERMRD